MHRIHTPTYLGKVFFTEKKFLLFMMGLKNPFSETCVGLDEYTSASCFSLGTIPLRRRQIFTIFDPYPLPSVFQQNAYEGDF